MAYDTSMMATEVIVQVFVERFWSRVNKKKDGCWEWTSTRQRKNGKEYHGIISFRGLWLAHRVAWELTYGPIPEGMQVCHRCDNPPCVRPDHLFLGTFADNMNDKVAKGRHLKHAPASRDPVSGRYKR